ncbi:hypothetical protein ACR3K2_00420 [Cryptosporidium serpentis]
MDIYEVLKRQSENLKRLEDSINNAMKRIENIENMCVDPDLKHIFTDSASLISKDDLLDSLCEPLPSPRSLSSSCGRTIDLEWISMTLEKMTNCNLSNISDNCDFQHENYQETDEANIAMLETTELCGDDINGCSSISSFDVDKDDEPNDTECNKISNEPVKIHNKSSNIVISKEFIIEIRPDLEVSHLKSSSKPTIEQHIQTEEDSETLKIANIRLEDFSECLTGTGSLFSGCLGSNLSQQHYLYDEEENTFKDGSPDLERAENEFYYLRSSNIRGSITHRSIKRRSVEPHKVPLTARFCRDNIKKREDILEFNLKDNTNVQIPVTRVHYHEPYQVIVGYVQIPYMALNQNSINNTQQTTQKLQCSQNTKHVQYPNQHYYQFQHFPYHIFSRTQIPKPVAIQKQQRNYSNTYIKYNQPLFKYTPAYFGYNNQAISPYFLPSYSCNQ